MHHSTPGSPLTEDAIERIHELYLKTGDKAKVARELGHARSTVIRYTKSIDHPIVLDTIEKPDTTDRVLPRKIKAHTTFTMPLKWSKICFASCMHYPYQDDRAIGAMLNYVAANNFDLFVFGGDQADFYQISNFSKDPKRKLTTQDEIDAVAGLIKQVDSLNLTTIWMDGNHDHRLWKFISEGGLSSLRALEIPALFSLPDRWTYAESQVHLRLGNLLMLHGDLKGKGSGGAHPTQMMHQALHTSCVFGHFHRAEKKYFHCDGALHKAVASGHLCDVDKADYVRSPNWQQGFVTIDLDHATGISEIRDHVIENGRFRANGRTWTA